MKKSGQSLKSSKVTPDGFIYQGMGTTIIDGEEVRSESDFLNTDEEEFERQATLAGKSPRRVMTLAPAKG